MKTKIIIVDVKTANAPVQQKRIESAARIISRGGLVAFPTETVYGLGADAFNARAVRNIFRAKRRPADNPLIVHVSSYSQVKLLSAKIQPSAKKIMKAFWPGPLTVIVPKSAHVPHCVTAGLLNVAIRMPSHPIALSLIRQSETPIAAPSANIASRPSGTIAAHVISDLSGRIDAIIDGGEAQIGVESTVVDCSGKIPLLLRPGAITFEQLRKIIPIQKYRQKQHEKPKSPGMKYKHYAPRAQVIVVVGDKKKVRRRIEKLILTSKKSVAVLSHMNKYEIDSEANGVQNYFANSLSEFASQLFRQYRQFDESGVATIIVEGCATRGIGLALMNRIEKSATKIIRN